MPTYNCTSIVKQEVLVTSTIEAETEQAAYQELHRRRNEEPQNCTFKDIGTESWQDQPAEIIE